jgi:hypothetical protein
MSTGIIVLIALVAVVGVFAGWYLRVYLRQRGNRLITCPETLSHEAVRVDAGHAAATSLMGSAELRLSDCTRWPERQSCGQDCLAQIGAAPDGCLVRGLLARWYAGKTCALCGREVGEREWMEHPPALIDRRSAPARTVAWADVPPAQVMDVMATHEPICWNCHVTETFRREHGDLIVERPAFGPASDARR